MPVHIYWKTNSKKNITLREREIVFACAECENLIVQNIHLRRTAFAINKGKLSTCTMSNVIEYEYVTSGPLKGGQPASKGGANAPPPPAPPPPERNPDGVW